MTESDARPPETPDEPAPQPPPEPPRKRDLFPWLYAAGFLILAAGLGWVWLRPLGQPPAAAQGQQLAAMAERIVRLEQRPAPQMPDLGPLTARVSALEQRPSSSASAQPDLAPLEARIAALEARQPTDNQLAGRIDALSARADSLATAQRGVQSELERRLDADEGRLAAVERMASQVPALADRTARMAQVEAVRLSLDAGQKLGEIPGAPAALARFANTAPPTEARLRLAFPRAARDALEAARPATDGKPLLARVWAQAQDLVTVRQGDHVLVGDPAAGVLDRARVALDAGDLAGAVAAAGSLTGPPAQAMAGWLTEARALLEARAALIDWAARA
jgi:hypothetical protein